MTATPWGFRDILPEEAQAREEIALTVKGCFREHHYLPVETPLLEDKGSLEEGGRIADTPFKLFDDDGRLLVQVVMNNDMEPDSVFRVRDDANTLSIEPLPYSLED